MQFEESEIIEVVNRAWNWVIPGVKRILAVNSMANVLLLDLDGRYWRICPEELSAEIIANNNSEIQSVFNDPEYKADWQLLGLIDKAEEQLGKLKIGECYALVKPAVVGGDYSTSNMKVSSINDYLAFSGDVAFQTKDLKEGDKVKICITE